MVVNRITTMGGRAGGGARSGGGGGIGASGGGSAQEKLRNELMSQTLQFGSKPYVAPNGAGTYRANKGKNGAIVYKWTGTGPDGKPTKFKITARTPEQNSDQLAKFNALGWKQK